MTSKIELTRGKFAIVDADMVDWLDRWTWYALRKSHTWYATTQVKRRGYYLHHAVLGGRPPKGMVTDHINGDGLDNRRANLRFVTPYQSNWNRRRFSNNTSGFIGVHKKGHRWQALVYKEGIHYYLGCFDDPVEAALVRDAKIRELFGEYAVYNFPKSGERGVRT